MSHEDFNSELQALRENLPTVVEEAPASKSLPDVYYSLDLAKRIADYFVQGLSLHQISRKADMPSYGALLRWSKEHADLASMLRAIRQSRALHFESAAIETAEQVNDPEDVPAARLKVETYKWAAEVNDPEVYGKKVAHSGNVQGTTVIQVVTGFGPPPPSLDFPKLKADGTIDKETAVDAEVIHEKEDGTTSTPET